MRTNLAPWRSLSELIDEAFQVRESGGVYAPLDIVESDAGYEIAVDLPGVQSEDVEVEFREGRLWVSAERKPEPREEGKKYHRLERRSGKVNRVVALPEDVATDRIEATFKDGVLRIGVPKAETARPRKIEVKVT